MPSIISYRSHLSNAISENYDCSEQLVQCVASSSGGAATPVTRRTRFGGGVPEGYSKVCSEVFAKGLAKRHSGAPNKYI